MAANYAYLGQGTEFPITVEKGTFKLVSGPGIVEDSMTMILTTPIGTRYWLPQYGCNVYSILWEPNDQVLARLVQHSVMTALTTWEPRAVFHEVRVAIAYDAVLCNIIYRIKTSDELRNFIFPFPKSMAR